MGDLRDLIILGSGGYAQELLWIVDDLNAVRPTWNLLGFIDPAMPFKKGLAHYDRPILGGWDDAPQPRKDLHFACGIWSAAVRRKECQKAEQLGYLPASLIHPSVIIARHVEVGEGTIVGAGCILAPYARTGRHCALNLQVALGHNSSIGDYCVISPGAHILESVVLDDEVFIGANATVYMRAHVGAGALVGANSFLLGNLASGESSIGVPASAFAHAVVAEAGAAQKSDKKTKPAKRKKR
jgi:sugar O-acyltransferase (sialic acid O-acetyltransferase NeuD family)